jgi:hypothetical protein
MPSALVIGDRPLRGLRFFNGRRGPIPVLQKLQNRTQLLHRRFQLADGCRIRFRV